MHYWMKIATLGRAICLDSTLRPRNATVFGLLFAIFAYSACPAHGGWVCFNDCARVAGDSTAANVTSWTVYNGSDVGLAAGYLKDMATGQNVPARAAFSMGPEGLAISGASGANPAAGTDAHALFDGIVDFSGPIVYYGSYGWHVDITISGLDPVKKYTLAGTAIRGSDYPDRQTAFTLIGAVGAVNNSSDGAVFKGTTTTILLAGDNSSAGCVVRWDDIRVADDGGGTGSFTIRAGASDYTNNLDTSDRGRAYPLNGFMLQEIDMPGPDCPAGDLDGDCIVSVTDVARFAAEWLQAGMLPANLDGQGVVDGKDFAMLAGNWLVNAQTGSLKVILDEPVSAGAQWRVDGGDWHNSGERVTGLSVGTHAVAFNDVAGWNRPAERNVEIRFNETTILHAAYGAQTGSVQVIISDPGPFGAQWQIDGGAWHASGEIVGDLSVGSHLVAFSDAADWGTPTDKTVEIVNGETALLTVAYVRHTGGLTVTIAPAEAVDGGALWRIDGGAWQASGATVTGLATGEHTISYSDVAGWNRPADSQVTIINGQTATVTGTYTLQTGSLTVTIAPAEAAAAGAQWRVDGGAWQAGGATVSGLSIGGHTVEYRDAAGWTNPGSEMVTIFNGQMTTLAAKYTQQTGSVSVTIAEPKPAGAQWRVDGGTWQASGAAVGGLAVGTHLVEYAQLSGWDAPEAETVTVTADQTTFVVAAYVEQTGSVTVTISPAAAAVAGAQWRIDEGPWRDSGTVESNLSVGQHTVQYKAIADWDAPADETVTVYKNQTTATSGAYAQHAGSLRVTIVAPAPAGAQWRVDSGPWQAGGATVSDLPVGEHLVEYAEVAGYDTPNAETVTINKDQLTTTTGAYVQQTGALTVTITPAEAVAAGAQWRVDGGAWNTSGATVGGLPVGMHTVEYSEVAGWARPGSAAVEIVKDQTTTATGTYTQQTGSLRVTISPQGAVDAGAQWRVDGGAWQDSSVTLSGLSVGSHLVSYSDVTGWKTPANAMVDIVADQTANITGTYVEQTGAIHVVFDPTAPGAQWRVDGGIWKDGGDIVSGLQVGSHAVTYSTVANYDKPADESVEVLDGQTTVITAVYVQHTGSLTVTISPAQAAAEGARWRVDGGAWNTSGATVSGLAAGDHTIEFNTIADWDTPGDESVTIVKDQTATASGVYILQTGSVSVTIAAPAPTGAGWRIDAGAWQVSGAVVGGLRVGGYALSFADVEGWDKPADETVMVTKDQTTTLTRAYAEQAGSLTVTISPSEAITAGAQWRVDGGTWQDSGGTVGGLPTGPHAVSYSSTAGWDTPADDTVEILNGQTTTVTATYAEQTGSLTVTISPAEAVAAGAQWQVDAGPWHNSGETVNTLPVGTHTVAYNSITDWDAPADESVDVFKNQTTLATGTYVQQTGSLQVAISPLEAVGAGAQWRVDGGMWRDSGAIVSSLPVGVHLVEYSDTAGFDRPADENVTIVAGQLTLATADYIPQTGSLTVTITPMEVVAEGAQWRVDDGSWRSSGTTVSGLAVGIHSVEFAQVIGWTTPESREVEIFAETTASVTGNYVLIIPVSLQINEFMASNDSLSGIADGQGQYDDWFELYNATASAVDIGGMYVGDDSSLWRIPTGYAAQTTIPAGGYLLLWADNDTADGPLHVGFQLNADGDMLRLYDSDGVTLLDSISFDSQIGNVSYGRYPDGTADWFYFDAASPGSTNNTQQTFAGQVADTKFDYGRGFYAAPVDVSITTETLGATIYYTLDGSPPIRTDGTPTVGAQVYTGPIPVATTTTLRAAAVKIGWLPTNIDTQTYVFVGDVVQQDGSGLPAYHTWSHFGTADWEMDPEVVGSGPFVDDDGLAFDAADALLAAPTLSLAMDWDDWFGNQGIYIDGESVERVCSAELISPDGTEDGFQVNCTVQIVGGTSPSRWKMDKLSMRLKFRQRMDDGTPTGGPGTLKYSMYPNTKVDVFNTLVLDARMNMTWAYGGSVRVDIDGDGTDDLQNPYAQYTRDQFPGDIQNAMGGYAPHGRPVHLYLNGLYWGLYFVHERPDGAFGASYLGGEKEDYDVLKHDNGEAYVVGFDDDPAAKTLAAANYDALSTAANRDLTDAANYQALLNLLDVDDFIDYMLMNFYIGNTDWAHHNWYAGRNRVDPAGKWRYHNWDPEHCLKYVGDNVVGRDNGDGSPTDLHQDMRRNVNYRRLFGDHVHRHFFNGGILSPGSVADLYQYRIDLLDRAVVAESARWGDNQRTTPYTREVEWLTERDRMFDVYFPQRSGIVFSQLRTADLYPDTDAPVFYVGGVYQHGGYVTPQNNALSMDNPNGGGTIYYTLDGSDPRFEIAGAAATDSSPATKGNPETTTILIVSDSPPTGSPDESLVAFLQGLGYIVDTDGMNGNYQVAVSPWNAGNESKLAHLQDADLILVSRRTTSGFYSGDVNRWNELQTPILLMSGYLVRNTHWAWTNGASADASLTETDIVVSAGQSGHPFVAGLSSPITAFSWASAPKGVYLPVGSFAAGSTGVGTFDGLDMLVDIPAGTTLINGDAMGARRAFLSQWGYDQTGYEFSDYITDGYRTVLANVIAELSGTNDPTANRAPAVDAGANAVVVWPDNSIAVDATVTDDGRPDPPAAVSLAWSMDSGPAGVSFGELHFAPSAAVEDPTVTFPELGTYVLRLTADDGELSAADTVVVEVVNAPSSQPYTGPIALTHSVRVKACVLYNNEWSAVNEAVYAVGPVAENLRITEMMYHPADPPAGSPYNDDDFEYIELKNVGVQAINLGLVRFANGLEFAFGNTSLGAGQYVLVVSNRAAFESRYGTGLNVAGEYAGFLDNGGESVELVDAAGQIIHDFKYSDGWYDITDGQGFSLTVRDALAADLTLWDSKGGWRPSAAAGGSPGWDDSGQVPAPGDIVINEVLAHSHATEPDWIELHNTTTAAISIGGWFLSDSGGDLTRYEIADGVSIPAGGYVVFYEDQHFNNTGDPGCHVPFALSENGETVYVTSGQGGVITGYTDEEDFGASETGVSFGRYQKSGGTFNFVAMSEQTPGYANAYPKVGPIVISEIMYHPAGNADAEYVELLNITGSDVTLYDYATGEPWIFEDDGGFRFTFPAAPVTLQAGERILLVKDMAAFSGEFTPAAGTQIFAWGGGSLSNGGERIQLLIPGDVDALGTRCYIRVDRVVYSDGAHPAGDDPWPVAPDGAGDALHRVVAAGYGNDVINWQAAAPTPGW